MNGLGNWGGMVLEQTTMGDIAVDVLSRPPCVTVVGDVDIAATRELRTVLHGLLSMGHDDVDLDLAGVEHLDPSVPDVFDELWRRGQVLHLRNPSAAAQEQLHLEAS